MAANDVSLGPSVSVALATYNGARFLQAQLESVRAQTLAPAEIVVGDDRSSDATVSIVDAFAETVPFPVRLTVNDANLHFGENFLQTAARCSSRYIAFCDQDDVWLPEKLERCVTAMEAEDAVLCGHDAWLIDAEGKRLGRFDHMKRGGAFAPRTLAPWGVFFGFSTMIRRDCLEALPADARGIDPITPARKLAHDRWAYHLGTTLGRTVYLKEPLVLYRQHGGNTFGAAAGGLAARVRKLLLTSPDDVALHLETCRRRADALASLVEGPFAQPAEAGAAHWRRLAEIYEARLALARDGSLPGRCRRVAGLARHGAYAAADRGGLSRRAFAKDALAAVLPWRTTAPLGAPAGQKVSS